MNSKNLDRICKRLDIISEILNDDTPLDKNIDINDIKIGVDLGTADIQTIALDKNGTPIAAFFDWANVVKDGVVVDYFGACQIVRHHIDCLEKKLNITVNKVYTSFPPGTDPQISVNVIESAGIEVQNVVDEPSSVAKLLKIDSGVVVDIGGGTTGSAIIEGGNIKYSYDDATGGHHATLVISGALKKGYEEAEEIKRDPEKKNMLSPILKPVVENMADIVKEHIKKAKIQVDTIYLSGGGCLLPNFLSIFEKQFPDLEVVFFDNALYLTPLAIASLD